jgi:hypothetical protein
MLGVWLQRQRRRLTRREWIYLQWKTLTGIYDPYLRFAPAQAYRRRASASLCQKSAFLLGDRIWIITQQTPPWDKFLLAAYTKRTFILNTSKKQNTSGAK